MFSNYILSVVDNSVSLATKLGFIQDQVGFFFSF